MAIVLFTDLGSRDIYVGQVKAALYQYAQNIAQIDLLHDAPGSSIKASAHLLAALTTRFGPGNVFLAMADAEFGEDNDALVLLVDGNWFVGPDNGLLSVLAARAASVKAWRIDWRPAAPLSRGRDLYAPIAALIARGEFPTERLTPIVDLAVQLGGGDLAEIIWIDRHGNAVTGLRAAPIKSTLKVSGATINRSASLFSADGLTRWRQNALGLVEIATPRGNATKPLELQIGQPVFVA